MAKVLVEMRNGALLNVETTSDDVEVFVVDHDIIHEGSIGELKRYLRDLDAPVEVDAVVPEDDLVAKLEDLIAEGEARLEDMADAWENNETDEAGEIPDLTQVRGRGRQDWKTTVQPSAKRRSDASRRRPRPAELHGKRCQRRCTPP